MAKRPSLSDKSFLAHLFSPKKNALPSGLRKITLKGLGGGRKAARLKSFNGMSAANQEVLKRSGLRDAYLKGDASLADAKSVLRPQAIALGAAKPVRVRGRVSRETSLPSKLMRTALDIRIAAHLKTTVRAEGKNVNDRTVEQEMIWLDNGSEDMTKWSYGQIKYAGRKDSEYNRWDDDGVKHNPFWYH